MSSRYVVGVNWGDEGKGRMVDYFAKDADYVVRYQGGSNAGHTVINEFGKFALHTIPSGIFYKNVVNVIGTGVAANLQQLDKEIDTIKAAGIKINSDNLKISERAFICFPFHQMQDTYEEERLGGQSFGSTKQGIAPAYGDLYMKFGVQVGDIKNPDYIKAQLGRALTLKNLLFKGVYNKEKIDEKAMLEWALNYGEKLKPYICDTVELFDNAQKQNKKILFEAQLGSLRDIYYGIYPYTTSSCTLAGFGGVGAGAFRFSSPLPVVTGVVKCFSTCVGEGAFTTEIFGAEADELRTLAGEFGATTGRPRRIGHFDGIASRYGALVQSCTEIALTKLDCLSGKKTLKVCTHYEVNGVRTEKFPMTSDLNIAKPVYTEMPGWTEDLTGIRKYADLPKNCRAYIETLEKLIQVPVKYISVGPERSQLIVK